MSSTKNILLFGAAMLTIGAFSPAQAFCGFYAGKADATLFNEASQVVVARDANRTVLSMSNDYQGPLTEFALIVPTPVVLQQGQVRIVDRAVFEHLDAYSSPRLAEYYDRDPCEMNFAWGHDLYPRQVMALMAAPMAAAPAGAARAKALGVTVEAKYTLGEYDIVSLSAQQSDGLETWLRENGYKIPKGASAALKPYINQGMKFFVAKVNLKEQLKTGYSTLRPLQFAFESEKFMLPMRLGMLNAPPDKAQDLIIYLLTRQGRVESSNYRTVKLPANVNLPDFIKPRFEDFYKAMYDTASKREDYRAVFTEYFWNMAWCDPCAAQPLRREELYQAGVFWLDGDVEQGFRSLQNPVLPSRVPPIAGNGAEPVLLTRLHVRYKPRTFPEDLMFIQTGDTQNWQARYVIQNPYGGTVAECSARVGKMDCAAMCEERVSSVQNLIKGNDTNFAAQYRGKSRQALSSDCLSSCEASKAQGLEAAMRYYQKILPERIAAEEQTLAQLTGWSLHDIDAMPGATRISALTREENAPVSGAAPPAQTWWQRLFSR
jgi:hypothetical protein